MNIPAIRRALKRTEAAVEELNVFDMGYFVAGIQRDGCIVLPHTRGMKEACGSACCFAGYALNKREVAKAESGRSSMDYATLAAGKLGLALGERRFSAPLNKGNAWRLFDSSEWPWEFRSAYEDAHARSKELPPCTKKRLKFERKKIEILKARVEHFITTGGE